MVKATQRDARRYKLLVDGLRCIRRDSIDFEPHDTDADVDDGDRASLLLQAHSGPGDHQDETPIDDSLVEPVSWSALAYSGFMWWASAGEQDLVAAEEAERDRDLVCGVFDYDSRPQPDGDGASPQPPDASVAAHTAVIASFHRLTSLLVNEMAEAVEAAGEENGGDRVVVEREDLVRMGLDMWSETDKAFVKEMIALYYDRDAEVHGASVECCGVKIC